MTTTHYTNGSSQHEIIDAVVDAIAKHDLDLPSTREAVAAEALHAAAETAFRTHEANMDDALDLDKIVTPDDIAPEIDQAVQATLGADLRRVFLERVTERARERCHNAWSNVVNDPAVEAHFAGRFNAGDHALNALAVTYARTREEVWLPAMTKEESSIAAWSYIPNRATLDQVRATQRELGRSLVEAIKATPGCRVEWRSHAEQKAQAGAWAQAGYVAP